MSESPTPEEIVARWEARFREPQTTEIANMKMDDYIVTVLIETRIVSIDPSR